MSRSPERETHPFESLTPDIILDAVESLDYVSDGRLLALNSYENRVFQVGLDAQPPLIAKFYRPERWSDDAILEEHHYSQELADAGLSVVAPLKGPTGSTLHNFGGFRFSLSPRRGGHAPDLDNEDVLTMMGRFLGRWHAQGGLREFRHRPTLTLARFGEDSVEYLLANSVPADLRPAYEALANQLLDSIRERLGPAYSNHCIRVHGDLHRGNILWRDDYFNVVDLDDCCHAPAIQDIWMLLSGEREQQALQLAAVLKGYLQFCDLPPVQLNWIEALRTLRMMHYAAWLARRQADPAFISAFPWFGSSRYWSDHILSLREQQAALQEAPLTWPF